MQKSFILLFSFLVFALCTSIEEEDSGTLIIQLPFIIKIIEHYIIEITSSIFHFYHTHISDVVSDFRCNYCKLKPFDGRPNTYCKFKSYLKKPHSRCTKDFKFGISKKDEREILKAHNDYRR